MITYGLLAINATIFIYIHLIAKGNEMEKALKIGAFYPPYISEKKEYWRFFTCNFIHVDVFHFFMNMYAIYQLGRFFEMIMGSVAYILIVLISMLLSSLMCYTAGDLFEKQRQTVTIGASGIVYGFFGAICALGVLVGGGYSSLLQQSASIILINIVFTIFHPQISKAGHLGGFIGGFVGIVILLTIGTL